MTALSPRPGSFHIDATVGGGGHALRILEATSPDGLVDVIEMVERLVRRSGGASANGKLMSDMQFARELLGLGNTRFVEVDFEATRPR